jgi:molybdopterin-binding protein
MRALSIYFMVYIVVQPRRNLSRPGQFVDIGKIGQRHPADAGKGESEMKISARNALKGKIVAIKKGAVMAQVTVDIGNDNRVVSAIFVDSVEDLGMKVGSKVLAVIKSTDVMIARP